jgi:PhzF family phenazine biosynthesis protein
MTDYAYRIVNVFTIAGERFSGNPLCVFEDARGLDDATMQALALQFNLSETTFILPSDKATARVRIFTPAFEMPFAGHPTLGTAHVVQACKGAGNALTLEMQAGLIPVSVQGDQWTLQANAPVWRRVEASKAQLAQMLGVGAEDVGDVPLWVNAGSEQLVIPLTSVDAVRRSSPDAALLQRYGYVREERYLAYVWAEAGDGQVEARFFFPKGTSVTEDPATGSACANLGGWFLARAAALPVTRLVRQGAAVKRPCHLGLQVDEQKRIFVSGDVVEFARGVVRL